LAVTNITLSVEDAALKKARKVAVDHDTTLTAMIREFIRSLSASDLSERERRVATLQASFARLSRDMGERTWTREELYEG